jgi:hypothetical protein
MIKNNIRFIIHCLSAFFLPKVKVSKNIEYKMLGDNNHYFVGYYDKNPVDSFGKNILCHRISNKYTKFVEPEVGEVGLMSIADNEFTPIATIHALNWQLGSRVQWLSQDTIIYNDIIKSEQCSIKFNISTKEILFMYKRPFWDISTDKKFGASLNFSRIKDMRPGYGYSGKNTDGDKDVLTVFSLDNDKLIYQIGLDEIIKTVNYKNLENEDMYLNHIVWSPCSTKLMTIFHYENKNKRKRMIFPVLIDISTKSVDLIYKDGYFSHHTFIDKNRILAYLKLDSKYSFAIWSKNQEWVAIKGSMPELDGHPTYISSTNRILVDSYPNRLGVMSLYLGSPNNANKLNRIAYVINSPKYVGSLRCDLHPRVSEKHKLIICDIPHKNGRKILVLKGALHD